MKLTSKIVLVVLLLGAVAGSGFLWRRAPAPEQRGDVSRSSSPSPSPSPSGASGSPAAPTGPEDLAARFAQRLAELAVRNKEIATARGNVVTLGSDTVLVETKLEHDEAAEGGKRGIGIAVGTTLSDGLGTFHFTAGAVGLGRTREEAMDQAIGGWLGLSGTAIVEAVARRGHSTISHPFGKLVAFPGQIAVRGQADLRWTPPREREFLGMLSPVLQGLDPASSHSVAISLTVLGGGAIDGQCLVDDRAAEDLCKLAMKYDWPASNDGYFVRQVYLLRPTLAVPAEKAPAAPQ